MFKFKIIKNLINLFILNLKKFFKKMVHNVNFFLRKTISLLKLHPILIEYIIINDYEIIVRFLKKYTRVRFNRKIILPKKNFFKITFLIK